MSSAAAAAAASATAIAPNSVAAVAPASVTAPAAPFLSSRPLDSGYTGQSSMVGASSDQPPPASPVAPPPTLGDPSYTGPWMGSATYAPHGAAPLPPAGPYGAVPVPAGSAAYGSYGAAPLPPAGPYGAAPVPAGSAAYGPYGAATSSTGHYGAPPYAPAAAASPAAVAAAPYAPYAPSPVAANAGSDRAPPPPLPYGGYYPPAMAASGGSSHMTYYTAPPPADHAVASTPFYFAHLIPVKLTTDNYLSWRAQVLPLLRSRYLEGYVDGSLPCPPPHHPAYHAWVAQDQAILSAIQSSLTEGVSSLVLFTATSQEAWSALHTSFASQQQARAHTLRTELGETKLLDLSITDYFGKMTRLADTLASIGQPLRKEDFTTFVMNGLDDDYDNLAENINGRDTPLEPRELYARLLATEQRIKSRRTNPSFMAANAATRGKGKPFKSTAAGKTAPLTLQAPRSPAAAPFPTTGGGRSCACCPSCGVQLPCQLCNIPGHVASRCHRRFKQDFLGVGNNGKGNEKQAALATHEPARQAGHTTSYPIDPTWYMDTGATNHLTGEMGKLSVQEPYRGNDQVHTASGAGMHISHVGQASLLTHKQKSLHLRNVLRVPSATRSLLSVPQLTRDNNVFTEFHPFYFFIKDRATRDVLLRGRLRDGLYALDLPSAPRALTGVRVSPTHWHARLGHPATPIVRSVLHRHSLPVVSNKDVATVCDACQQGKSHQLSFSDSSRVVKTPLELIYSDVWGHAQTSVSGHNYYVSFIDAYSRFTWLYLIKRKSDVFDVFLQFQAHVVASKFELLKAWLNLQKAKSTE